MGKKVERTLKDKSVNSAHHDTLEEGSHSPDPYVCLGKFHDDYSELCNRANLPFTPAVVLRARRPGTPPPPPEIKVEKGGKEKGKKGVVEPVQPPQELEVLPENGEPPEPPPKTYIIRDRFEYFKPIIQVDMDHPDKHDTVTEVYIRSWKIDDIMMNIFKQCWSCMDKLHTIHLWNVGMSEEMVAVLSTILPLCPAVRSLFLDANTPPIKAENYHILLMEDSQLQNLSLRHNQITDKGAKEMSKILGGFNNPNTKLVSLNLTGNRIGDDGAISLADALRMNRTLLSLTLAQNQITDVGAKALAQSLKAFPLNHDEVVERRRLKSEKGIALDGKSPPPSRRVDSKDRPGSHRSSSHLGKDKRDKSSKKKEEKQEPKAQTKGNKATKETEKVQTLKKDGTKGGKVATAENITKATAKSKDKKGGKGTLKGAAPNEPEPEATDIVNPLLEVAEMINSQLWIPGNRVLINLNLQKNKITADGVAAFKSALQYQETILSETPKAQGTGLMRLLINKNLVDVDHAEMVKLTEFMVRRDPFYKPSATPADYPPSEADRAR